MRKLFFININQLKNTTFTFLILFIFIMSSCTKDEQTESIQNVKQTYSIDVDRKVVNGILTFETLEDLRKYHVDLTKLTDNSDNSDEVFEYFERDYNSLRPIIEAKRIESLKYNHSKKSDDDANAQGDFILEVVRESMLNEYYEVGVGDSIYVYISLNQQYRLSQECATDLEVMRSIERGNHDEIDPAIIRTGAELLQSATHSLTRSVETSLTSSCSSGGGNTGDNDDNDSNPCISVLTGSVTNVESCQSLFREFDLTTDHNIFDCSTFELITSFLGVEAIYDIDFGDGTTTTVIGSGWVNVTHTYPSSGDFDMVVIATSVDITGQPQESTFSQIVNVQSNATCADENATLFKTVSDFDNNRHMQCKAYYINDFWGTHAGARTTGWKEDDDGEFVKERGIIWVEVDLDWMNSDCTLDSSVDESDDCNNCKSKRAQKTRSKRRSLTEDGTLVTRHRYDDNGASFDETLTLQMCE